MGERRPKRFEKALSGIGVLQPGGYATPGSAAQMDAYGNQSRGQIVQIMSVLRAFGEQGYNANRTKKWGKRSRVGQIFVVRQGNIRRGLKPGVYKRTSTGVECLMIFPKKAPHYTVRLPFDQIIQADAAKIFPVEMQKAWEESAKWKK